MSRCIMCVCFDTAFRGGKYCSKSYWISLRWLLEVLLLLLTRSSNSCSSSPHIILCRYLIRLSTALVPVSSIVFLKFFRSVMSSFYWPFSKIFIFGLQASDMYDAILHSILTLVVLIWLSSLTSVLENGIGGGSIYACMSALKVFSLIWFFTS